MPVSNYTVPGAIRWAPDSDEVNAAPGIALRADNMVPDEAGDTRLRRGSTTLYNFSTTDDVNSIYTEEIDGTTYQFANVGNKLYKNGVDTGVTFDGSGDVAFGDDSYQIFMSRGTTHKKWDGTSIKTWDISAPSIKPTISSTAFTGISIADFGSAGETVAGTFSYPDESTGGAHSTSITGYDSTSNGATSVTCNTSNYINSIQKTFTAVQNLYEPQGETGSDTDLFDIFVWLEDPKKVDKITLMFGLTTDSDPFITDYYYFDFVVYGDPKNALKSAEAAATKARENAAKKLLESPDAATANWAKSPDEVAKILEVLNRRAGGEGAAGPSVGARPDSVGASPAWTHLSVLRGQFTRVGGTTGKDWKTVKAVKIVYSVLPGDTTTCKAYFDGLKVYGGGDRAVTGTFKAVYRYARVTDQYTELSPPSPVSDPITVTHGLLTITIPAAGIAGANALQTGVTNIWVYLYGGWLDTYYRVEITGLQNTGTLALDEFDPSTDGTIDTYDQMRFQGPDLTKGTTGGGPSLDLTVSLSKSELQILIENESLEPGLCPIPDNLVAIAGPWLNRMFCLTNEGWLYVSSNRSPSSFSVYHAIDLRRYGTPKWMVKTNGGIHCGFTKDVVRIAGTGETSPDKSRVNLYGSPLGVGNPPIDEAVFTDGSMTLYRSADGLVALSGASSTLVDQGPTTLLWRGQDRHGQLGVNVSAGRFRMIVDNQIMYVLMSEGDSTSPTSIWRYYMNSKEWCRTTYTNTFMSIFREPSGRLVAGTNAGKIIVLDTGYQDDSADVAVNILLPYSHADSVLNRKIAADLQIHCDTGGSTGTLTAYKDGSDTIVDSFTFSTSLPSIYRMNASGIGSFFKIQFEITGNFYDFQFSGLSLSYRPIPQMMMVLDTGHIVHSNPFDVAWIQEVEIDCISPSNLEMDIYRDDVLYTTLSVPVTASVRKSYKIPVPREAKAVRPRLVFRTTASDGAGDIGFEPYMVKLKLRNSSHQQESVVIPYAPVGQSN